jgi:hypothetical protein
MNDEDKAYGRYLGAVRVISQRHPEIFTTEEKRRAWGLDDDYPSELDEVLGVNKGDY